MLMAFWEVMRLTREINELEYRAHMTRNKLSKYQKYAGTLGGTNTLSAMNLAGLSPMIFPRACLFAQYSNQASSMCAMQNLQMMKMYGMMPWTGNPLTQYQLEMSAFARFKQESMKALKEQEKAALNEIEKEIELELADIETSLKIKRTSLQSTKELLKEQAQNSGVKFGL